MKLLPILLVLFACQAAPDASAAVEVAVPPPVPDVAHVDPEGTTVRTRFPTPEGFRRAAFPVGSFGKFLQNQPLKPHGTSVKLFSGAEKPNQNAHAAVLDIDVGHRDLQQCADAIMRLRAEYLYAQQRYEDIHFNFVSGFRAEYTRWRAGQRIQVNGNRVTWTPGRGASPGYAAFRKYLTMVFSYAGTASLVRELHPKELNDISVGDVFIRGGHPGHAVIVVDKIVHATTGEIRVLLAQSYMPAQDIHVLVNPLRDNGDPWYSLAEMRETVQTAEYTFRSEELRTFPQQGS